MVVLPSQRRAPERARDVRRAAAVRAAAAWHGAPGVPRNSSAPRSSKLRGPAPVSVVAGSSTRLRPFASQAEAAPPAPESAESIAGEPARGWKSVALGPGPTG